MSQSKEELFQKLNSAKFEGGGHVTYLYENGVKQRQPINKEVFFKEKNKIRSVEEVLEVFNDTTEDLGAVGFEI